MIVRTFESDTDAATFAVRAGWTFTDVDEAGRLHLNIMIDDEGYVRQLRSSEDKHGKFWYWQRL